MRSDVGVPLLAVAVLTPKSAGVRLQEMGAYRISSNGDLMLDKGLTRVEPATIPVRIDDPNGEFADYPEDFVYLCSFTNVLQ